MGTYACSAQLGAAATSAAGAGAPAGAGAGSTAPARLTGDKRASGAESLRRAAGCPDTSNARVSNASKRRRRGRGAAATDLDAAVLCEPASEAAAIVAAAAAVDAATAAAAAAEGFLRSSSDSLSLSSAAPRKPKASALAPASGGPAGKSASHCVKPPTRLQESHTAQPSQSQSDASADIAVVPPAAPARNQCAPAGSSAAPPASPDEDAAATAFAATTRAFAAAAMAAAPESCRRIDTGTASADESRRGGARQLRCFATIHRAPSETGVAAPFTAVVVAGVDSASRTAAAFAQRRRGSMGVPACPQTTQAIAAEAGETVSA